MRFRLDTLFVIIAGIAVALAIGRLIGLKGSLAFLCASGFVAPALVANVWIRAALAFGLTGLSIVGLYVLGVNDGEVVSLLPILRRAAPVGLAVGVAALGVSSRLRWGYCHPARFSQSK